MFLTPRNATMDNNGKVNLLKGEIPDVLLPFNNEFYRPATQGHGKLSLTGWTFEIPGAPNSKLTYFPNEIIRIFQANPYDWLRGLSNYEPAQIAIFQDIKSDIYNTKLYDNNAIPAGILASDDWLSDDQRKEMMKSWYEEFGGIGNAQKTAVLGKGLKYQHIGLTNIDMQYKEQKEEAFNKILADFGVNKIALGRYEQVNRATIEIGRKLLWTDTYVPMEELLIEAINSQWIFHVDPNIELCPDYSQIEVLRQDYTKRSKAGGEMVTKMFFPPVLAARLNNIPLSEEDIKLYPWLSEKPPQRGAAVIGNGSGEAEATEKPSKDISIETIKADKDQFWLLFVDKVLAPGERSYQIIMNRFFASQRNRMQDLVDEWLQHQKLFIPAVAKQLELNPESFLLDAVEENKRLSKTITPLVKQQLQNAKDQLEKELDGLIAWNVTDETIDRFVAKRKAEMRRINTTTFRMARKKIGDAITLSVLSNFTPQQTAKEVKSALSNVGEIRKNQAKTIARTEVGIIVSDARFEAFQAEGIEHHEWVTAGDEKVRDSHVTQGISGNNIVRVGIPFSPTGLMHPLDSNGPAEEVINCRCVALATRPPETT